MTGRIVPAAEHRQGAAFIDHDQKPAERNTCGLQAVAACAGGDQKWSQPAISIRAADGNVVMHKTRIGAWIVFSVLAISSRLPATDRPWLEVKSANFTVVSDAGEKSARTVLWELEQVRSAVKTFWSWAQIDVDRPILVLAPRDEASMRTLAPQYWEQKNAVRPASLFVTGPDRHYIALRADVKAADTASINPYRAAYWSYVALVLRSSVKRDLPLWFYLGMTELMSNTIVRETHLEIGRTIPWHLQRLRNKQRIPLPELLTLDRTSPWFQQGDKRPDLDAAAWALVHYLLFADEGAHRPQFDRFAALVLEGRTPAGATEIAFGNLDALERGFSAYVGRELFNFMRVNVDVSVKPERFSPRPLSAAETAVAQAAFHVVTQRPADARPLVEQAKKADPQLAATYEVDGMLLEGERKSEDARTAYEKAMELRSLSFYPYYRWAALTNGRPTSDATNLTRMNDALDQAMKLDGRFALSYGLAAEVRLRQGRRDEALTLAQRGVALDPGRMQTHLSFARVLWGVSRRDDAQREAKESLALATSDGERQAAQQLIDFFEKNRAPGASH
jgi:tetratricopeptide (TPR) repeat protein